MPEGWPAASRPNVRRHVWHEGFCPTQTSRSGPLGRVQPRNPVSNQSSLCISCEAFKYSKSFVARARLLQIQIGVGCLYRRPALVTKAHRFRLGRLRFKQVCRCGLLDTQDGAAPLANVPGRQSMLRHCPAPRHWCRTNPALVGLPGTGKSGDPGLAPGQIGPPAA